MGGDVVFVLFMSVLIVNVHELLYHVKDETFD